MHVADAQREVRQVYRGGFMGQLVSGVLWLGSAAAATWATPRAGILLLVIGGFFIFPLTTLGLRLLGGPWKLSAENPLGGAHYVPFVFLYGMRLFAALAGALIVLGLVLAHRHPARRACVDHRRRAADVRRTGTPGGPARTGTGRWYRGAVVTRPRRRAPRRRCLPLELAERPARARRVPGRVRPAVITADSGEP